jgi:flagellar biogenesis protein FliO
VKAVFLLLFCLAGASLAADGVPTPATGVTADSPTTRAIPFKQEEYSSGSLALRVVVSFALLIGLAYGALVLLKRYYPSLRLANNVGTRRIKVIEMQRLTPRLSLFLVEVDEVTVLLAQSGDRVHTVPTHGGTPVLHPTPAPGSEQK